MQQDPSEPDDSPRSPALPANVKVLGAASLCNDIASEMVFPLMPLFFTSVLGGSKALFGLMEGTAESLSSIMKLYAGSWSDRAGARKGFVVFGYGLTALLRPLLGIVAWPWQVLVVRLGDRLGKGVRTSPRDALIADSTPSTMRGRAFGFHHAMDNLGAAVGPLLAAAFLHFYENDYRTLFLLAGIPGIVVLGLLLLGLREVARHTHAGRELPRLTLAPFDRNFRLFLLALMLFTLGNSSDGFLLLRAGELGVTPVFLPLLWSAFQLTKSLGNLALGSAIDRWGAKLLLLLGWLVYAATYLAFALATTAWHAWIFFLIYAVYFGLTEAAEKTLIASLAGPERKGLAFGWFHFAIGLGSLPASLVFGFLYQQYGALTAFAWGAGLAMAASILLLGVRSPKVSARTD